MFIMFIMFISLYWRGFPAMYILNIMYIKWVKMGKNRLKPLVRKRKVLSRSFTDS